MQLDKKKDLREKQLELDSSNFFHFSNKSFLNIDINFITVF